MTNWLAVLTPMLVLPIVAIAVPAALEALKRRFPPPARSSPTMPREFTLAEHCLSLSVLAVFFPGVFAGFSVLEWMGGGELRWSNFFLYLAALIGASCAAPMLLARCFGRRFYTNLIDLSEQRGGISLRGIQVLISVGVGVLLLCAAVSRALE